MPRKTQFADLLVGMALSVSMRPRPDAAENPDDTQPAKADAAAFQ